MYRGCIGIDGVRNMVKERENECEGQIDEALQIFAPSQLVPWLLTCVHEVDEDVEK